MKKFFGNIVLAIYAFSAIVFVVTVGAVNDIWSWIKRIFKKNPKTA